jgi:hypothetical protein
MLWAARSVKSFWVQTRNPRLRLLWWDVQYFVHFIWHHHLNKLVFSVPTYFLEPGAPAPPPKEETKAAAPVDDVKLADRQKKKEEKKQKIESVKEKTKK